MKNSRFMRKVIDESTLIPFYKNRRRNFSEVNTKNRHFLNKIFEKQHSHRNFSNTAQRQPELLLKVQYLFIQAFMM